MAMHDVTIEKTILTLLDEKKYQTLKDILVTMEPSDIVAVFEELKEEKVPLLFRLLPKETAAEVFAELEPDWQELLIKGFSDTELRDVVNELYVVVDNEVVKARACFKIIGETLFLDCFNHNFLAHRLFYRGVKITYQCSYLVFRAYTAVVYAFVKSIKCHISHL